MVFCCRELLFSKLFYRHQQQQPPPPVLRGSRRQRRQQNLSTLLVLQKPWCFAAGGCFFRSCFTGISSSSRRQQNLSTNAVSLDFSRFPDDTLGSFFAWFWTLLVLPSHGVLLPGAAFFEAVFTGISSSSRRHQFCEQPQVTESFDLARPSELWCFAAGGCFFRSCFTGISSSNRRHQSCEQPQATESLDNLSTMCCFSRISDDTLGSFLAWFWTLLVLQSHGVLLPGAAFFEAVLPASAAAAAATSSASSRRQQNLSTNAVFLDFQTTR